MAIISAKKDSSVLVEESFKSIKESFDSYFFKIKFIIFFMFIFALFSPFLWLFLLITIFFLFNKDIWGKAFKNKELYSHYLEKFSCPFADEGGLDVLSVFGYEIDYDTQWQQHYHKLKQFKPANDDNISEEEIKKLADSLQKEASRIKKSQRYRESGIGKDLITRHLLYIGTTGAGKTESLLTWFADILDKKNSGGLIMIDGKADSKIHSKLSALIEEKGRITSFQTINMLKQEKMSTTNTYNPILSMSPFKGVSFMADLLPSESGGNAEYFKNRGIAMLTIPLSALRIRNEYFFEPFSLSLLQDSTSTLNITIIFALFYGFVKEENENLKRLIEKNEDVALLWQEAKDKSTAVNLDVEYYEKILNFVTQYKPSAKAQVEKIIGFEFRLFHMAYNMVFKLARAYQGEILSQWREMSNVIAEAIYIYAKEIKNREFSIKSKSFISFEEIRGFFDDLKNEAIKDSIISKSKWEKKKIDDFNLALGFGQDTRVTIFKLPEQALQQHSYSQQQFTALFQTFERFPHIFGSPFPDVSIKDTMKNNKILYIMLPVLELGKTMSELLGKMYVTDIKECSSEALGGAKLNLTPTQNNIEKDKITPKPISLLVADEYGYYRTEAMTPILAQIRSLNFGVILSLQETAGTGKDEEQEKILANSAKFILKSYDTKIKEFLDKQIREIETLEDEKYRASTGEIINSEFDSVKVQKKKALDSAILSDLNYGCGILISNSKPRIIQSYYFGGREVQPYISSMTRYIA